MFGKNRGELVLAEERGWVGGRFGPPKLVGEPRDTEAGDLSPRGFVQAELLLSERCCVCSKVLYLNEQGSWRAYRRIFRVGARTGEIT